MKKINLEEFKMIVTKDMLIGDVLDMDPGTAPFLFEMGMH